MTQERGLGTSSANRYDRAEIAGAFGDLGTLVPFVVAYIGVLETDFVGVLLAFGLSMSYDVAKLVGGGRKPCLALRSCLAIARSELCPSAAIRRVTVFRMIQLLIAALSDVHVELRIPSFALSALTLNDFWLGSIFLALPQVPPLSETPLSRLPKRTTALSRSSVSESRISTSTGLMNLLSASVRRRAESSWCRWHGGPVQFGARTGGALVVLGLVFARHRAFV